MRGFCIWEDFLCGFSRLLKKVFKYYHLKLRVIFQFQLFFRVSIHLLVVCQLFTIVSSFYVLKTHFVHWSMAVVQYRDWITPDTTQFLLAFGANLPFYKQYSWVDVTIKIMCVRLFCCFLSFFYKFNLIKFGEIKNRKKSNVFENGRNGKIGIKVTKFWSFIMIYKWLWSQNLITNYLNFICKFVSWVNWLELIMS